MPNISVSLTDKQLEELEFLIKIKNDFLKENEIPLEVTRSGVVVDLITKAAERARDINDNPAS